MTTTQVPQGARSARKMRHNGKVACRWREIVVGDDHHGQWAVLPAGEPQRFANSARVWFDGDVMICYPKQGWWTAHFWENLHGWITEPGAPPQPKALRNYVYVDMAQPAGFHNGVWSFVDLTLDVVTRADGSILILDEDEVTEEAKRYGIPSTALQQARRSCDMVYEAMTAGKAPFDGTADRWRNQFRYRDKPTAT